MKTFPKASDFIVPGKEIRVPEAVERNIFEEMTSLESEHEREEARAIEAARKIILDL